MSRVCKVLVIYGIFRERHYSPLSSMHKKRLHRIEIRGDGLKLERQPFERRFKENLLTKNYAVFFEEG